MAEDKQDILHTESPQPARSGKRQTCMRHCKRFWWIYLIVFCCIVVLVVCLVIFVAVPRIAQDRIDAAGLEIRSVALTQTSSDGYTMEINSVITTDGSIHAQVDPFEGMIYLEDLEPHTPFVTVNFPETNGDRYQEVNVTENIAIGDMDAFTTFNTWFTNNETLRITVDGRTHVQPRGLTRKYGVHFKKTLEINGLNLFRGTDIIEEDSHITIEEDDDGRNFYGVAELPNPTLFSLEIGNVSFTNFVGDDEIGTIYINDLILSPGTNRVNISGTMDQVQILSLVQSPAYCGNGTIPFKLLGDTVTNNGEDLDYFATALASANQTVSIDIGQIIQQDLNVTVRCVNDAITGLLGSPGADDAASILDGLEGLLPLLMPSQA